MKKVMSLIVVLVSIGFLSRVLACIEFECHDVQAVSYFVIEFAWKLSDTLL